MRSLLIRVCRFEFTFLFIAIGSVAYYSYDRWLAPKPVAVVEESRSEQMLDPLQATLIDGRELRIPEKPSMTSVEGQWNPKPQWRHEMSGSLSDGKTRDTSLLGPSLATQEFPLEPRFKKGPPIIGSALPMIPSSEVSPSMIVQPRSLKPNLDPPTNVEVARSDVSPFGNQPPRTQSLDKNREMTYAHVPAQQSTAAFGSPWPDQTFEHRDVMIPALSPGAVASDRRASNALNSSQGITAEHQLLSENSTSPGQLTSTNSGRVPAVPSPPAIPSTLSPTSKAAPSLPRQDQFIHQPRRGGD